MLNIMPINNYIMTQFLLNDPELCAMSLCDDHLIALDNGYGFTAPVNTVLGVYDEGKLICCLLLSMFTDITYEWHIYLGTKHHGKGVSLDVKNTFISWLKENTQCKTLITSVPVVCKWVHKALLNNGARLVGVIPNGITWRQKHTDLNIYSEDIKR